MTTSENDRGFRDLRVWHSGIDLAVLVYRITQEFPAAERFGLTAQMRRAAVSVPANIAEGHGRFTRGEFLNQLSTANGSLKEVETVAHLATRLDMLSTSDHDLVFEPCQEIGRMLTALKRSLRR